MLLPPTYVPLLGHHSASALDCAPVACTSHLRNRVVHQPLLEANSDEEEGSPA